MTTSNLMSLPIDIPWRRLAISGDMFHVKGDEERPPKWRSSTAIFYYEPSVEEQQLEGRTVTFLKVTCTITGYEDPDRGKAIGFVPVANTWDKKWWTAEDARALYYPCHGALLQVSVFPGSDDDADNIWAYPIIVDFEPKKREIYESLTENRQFMSFSHEGVKVSKGTTTTYSTESGWNMGGSASYGSGGFDVGGGGGYSQRTTTSTQYIDMLNTDTSRDKRENFSYTTNLNQIYHLLNSYHTGTNRTVFFMQPRPRIRDPERRAGWDYSFVQGLRKLEGVQDVFLIVIRPKGIQGLCVETTLETAHIGTMNVPKATLIGEYVYNAGKFADMTADAVGVDEDPIIEDLAKKWNKIPAPMKNKIWTLSTHFASYAAYKKTQEENDLEVTITEADWDTYFATKALVPTIGDTEKARVIYQRVPHETGTFFITGRKTSGCYGTPPVQMKPSDSLIYEGPLTLAGRDFSAPDIPEFREDINWSELTANKIANSIGRQVLESLAASTRYEYGELTLNEASFVQDPLVGVLRQMPDDHPYNASLNRIKGIEKETRDGLKKSFGVRSRKDALSLELYQFRAALDLTEAEARRLRTTLIGEGPTLELRKAPVIVPPLVGLTMEEARERIGVSSLEVKSDIAQQDSLVPEGTVLSQFPDAGNVVQRGDAVRIVASTGPTTVPEIVGYTAKQGIDAAKKATLWADTLTVVTDQYRSGTVIDTIPAHGSKLPKNAKITLVIAESAGPSAPARRARKKKQTRKLDK